MGLGTQGVIGQGRNRAIGWEGRDMEGSIGQGGSLGRGGDVLCGDWAGGNLFYGDGWEDGGGDWAGEGTDQLGGRNDGRGQLRVIGWAICFMGKWKGGDLFYGDVECGRGAVGYSQGRRHGGIGGGALGICLND